MFLVLTLVLNTMISVQSASLGLHIMAVLLAPLMLLVALKTRPLIGAYILAF
jgi:hypothetical protein